nr:zinc knuckle CX2CX4HX4C [Tanacetum cinerariifolium]
MVGSDLPPQPPLGVNPHMKKSMKSLKPLKTTRTMNPEAKNTIRHEEMLGRSSDVLFKRDYDVNIGKEGLIDLEESSKLFGNQNEKVNNSMDVDVVVRKIVSLLRSSGIKSNGIKVMPEMPVPVAENHILNPDFGSNSKPMGPTRVSFGKVKMHGMFRVSRVDLFKGVEFVSNFNVGEESRINDMNVGDKVNDFGRKVAKMDQVIEDGSAKWNMTVIGHFVGYRMSYREIMGNLRRMWRPYQFYDIIVNNSGLYFCNEYVKIDKIEAKQTKPGKGIKRVQEIEAEGEFISNLIPLILYPKPKIIAPNPQLFDWRMGRVTLPTAKISCLKSNQGWRVKIRDGRSVKRLEGKPDLEGLPRHHRIILDKLKLCRSAFKSLIRLVWSKGCYPESLIRRRNLGEPSSLFDFEEVKNNNHNQEPSPQNNNGPPPMVRPNGQAPQTMEKLCQPSINGRVDQLP